MKKLLNSLEKKELKLKNLADFLKKEEKELVIANAELILSKIGYSSSSLYDNLFFRNIHFFTLYSKLQNISSELSIHSMDLLRSIIKKHSSRYFKSLKKIYPSFQGIYFSENDLNAGFIYGDKINFMFHGKEQENDICEFLNTSLIELQRIEFDRCFINHESMLAVARKLQQKGLLKNLINQVVMTY